MQTVVIVIHLMIVATLIGAVLLQKSEGGGLGVGGGAGFMSSRGTANLLTRTTAVLAVGFFVTSLFLSWLASYDRKPSSIIDASPASQSQPAGRRRRSSADRRRHAGFAEEGGRAAAEPAGAVGSAGAAFAIKQGGHAGTAASRPASDNPHQYADNALNFTSPTARQNVCRELRFVLANRLGGLKG